MGEDAASAGEHSGRVAASPGHVDVSGADLHVTGHPAADAGGGQEVRTGRQDLARHHEERLQRPASSRRRRDREDAGAAEEELRAAGADSERPERLFGEKEALLPEILLPLQRRAVGDSVRDEGSHAVTHF